MGPEAMTPGTLVGCSCLTTLDPVTGPIQLASFVLYIMLQSFNVVKKPVRIITGMDQNAPEWASITGMHGYQN